MQMTWSDEKNSEFTIFKGAKSPFCDKASFVRVIILAAFCVIFQNFYLIDL